MNFNVGDIIQGNEGSNDIYGITNKKRGFVGKVIMVEEGAVLGMEDIKVQIMEVEGRRSGVDIGDSYWVESRFFTLYKDNSLTMKKLREVK